MAEHGLQSIVGEELREDMESRFAYLHSNDKYNGRHSGEYDFLETMLADEIVDDEGSCNSVMEDTEQSD